MKFKKFLCILLALNFVLFAFCACVSPQESPGEATPNETTPSGNTPDETTPSTNCGGFPDEVLPYNDAYYEFNCEAEAALALKNPDLFFSKIPETREWKKIQDMIEYFQEQDYIVVHNVNTKTLASDIYLSFDSALEIPLLKFKYDSDFRTVSYTPIAILEDIDSSKHPSASEIIRALNPDHINTDTFSENPDRFSCYGYKNVFESTLSFSGKTTTALFAERENGDYKYWFVIDGILFNVQGNYNKSMNFALQDIFTGETPLEIGMTTQEFENAIGKESVKYLKGYGENKYAFYADEEYSKIQASMVVVHFYNDKIVAVKVLAPKNLDFDVSFDNDFRKYIDSSELHSVEVDVYHILYMFGVPMETHCEGEQVSWTYVANSGSSYNVHFNSYMKPIRIEKVAD